MTAIIDQASAPSQQAFYVKCLLDAPCDLVWKAWTEAERLQQWWGPKGLPLTVCHLDLRPGGLFHYKMETPGGAMWGKFVYGEIKAPERLTFTVSFSDADAGTMRHPMSATWPLELLNTVTFTEHEGRTTLELEGIPQGATPEEIETFVAGREGMRKGFGGTFEQLIAYLATVPKSA